MAGSVSEWVFHYLDKYPFIKAGLKDGIINFSALARKIEPMIETEFGKPVNVDSVMVAIRRYGEKNNGTVHEPQLRELFAKASMNLQDGMSFAMFANAETVDRSIYETMEKEPWGSTEFRVLLGSPSHMIVMLKSNKMKRLLDKISNPDQLRVEHGFSILTLKIPTDAFKTPSMLSEISVELSKMDVPHMVLGVPPEIHFVVSEKNSSRAYEGFKKLLTPLHAGNGSSELL